MPGSLKDVNICGGGTYGTYSTTIEKDISRLQKEVVWGCLFTYDPEAAPQEKNQ